MLIINLLTPRHRILSLVMFWATVTKASLLFIISISFNLAYSNGLDNHQISKRQNFYPIRNFQPFGIPRNQNPFGFGGFTHQPFNFNNFQPSFYGERQNGRRRQPQVNTNS